MASRKRGFGYLGPKSMEAIQAGQFHVYPVESIDQGIEILTSKPAGERDEEGSYPEGSINYLVEEQLSRLAEKRQEFSAPAKEGS